ncbi:hypothetical protein BC829DRAFT_487144 [Chytridium lagenaria]|nr:hypothetical protein BC829DRAFT_487144 [Chytridium lagenaria]
MIWSTAATILLTSGLAWPSIFASAQTISTPLSAIDEINNVSGPYSLRTFAEWCRATPDCIQLDRSFSLMTMLVPTDDAFARSPPSSIYNEFHLLPSVLFNPNRSQEIRVFFNQSAEIMRVDITRSDLVFSSGGVSASVIDSIPVSNGILHIVDNVLSAPKSATETLQDVGLSAFMEAITSLGLNQWLDQQQDITIFAPSNDAMNLLSAAIEQTSLATRRPVENLLLQTVLSHIVPSVIVTGDMRSGTPVEVRATESRAQNAQVVSEDITARNCIIQVINLPILPEATQFRDAFTITNLIPNPANPNSLAETSLPTSSSARPFSTGADLPMSAMSTDAISPPPAQSVFKGDPNYIIWWPIVVTIVVSIALGVFIWLVIVRPAKTPLRKSRLELIPIIESALMAPQVKITLAQVLNGDTKAPHSLDDFRNHKRLTAILNEAGSVSSLEQLWNAADGTQTGSDSANHSAGASSNILPSPGPMSAENLNEHSPTLPQHDDPQAVIKLKDEVDYIMKTFLTEGSVKEVNVPSKLRKKVLQEVNDRKNYHPDVFRPALEHAYVMVSPPHNRVKEN